MRQFLFFIVVIISMTSCGYDFPFEKTESYNDTTKFDKIVVVGGSYLSHVINGSVSINNHATQSFSSIIGEHFMKYNISNEGIINAEFGAIEGYNIYANDTSSVIYGQNILYFPSEVKKNRPFDKNPFLPYMDFSPGSEIIREQRPLTDVTNFSIPNFNTEILIAPDLAGSTFSSYFEDLEGKTLVELVAAHNPDLVIMELAIDELINAVLDDNWEEASLDRALEERFGIFLQRLNSETQVPVILFNVPNITQFPFFNEVPYNIFISGGEAANLYNNYISFNEDVRYWNFLKKDPATPSDKRRPVIDFDNFYQPGNGYVIIDPTLSDAVNEQGQPIPKIRQLNPEEKIFYSLYSKLSPAGLGTMVPVADKFSLTSSEIAGIREKVNAYNQIIDRIVSVNSNVYLFDLNAFYDNILRVEEVENGLLNTGEVVKNSMLPNGIFSTDGIHLNERGNALLVNNFILNLNQIFSISIPLIETGKYKGNKYETVN